MTASRFSRIGLAPIVNAKERLMSDTTVADEQPARAVLRADDRPLNWGSEREMNGIETLMWRAEADPRLRSTICALEVRRGAGLGQVPGRA